MNFRQIVQDYFTFSRNERKGIIILLAIIFLLAIANRIIFYFETPAKIDTELLNATFSLSDNSPNNGKKKFSLFLFNPNTIDPLALDSLDLPEAVKKNMVRYREKGGHYYSVKDFKKTYGVTDSIYNSIEPYLEIDATVALPVKEQIKKQLFDFDPNQSGDNELQLLGFTERQIKTIRSYQQKGGYFYDAESFFKIYGLTESQKRDLRSHVKIEKKEFRESFVKYDKAKLVIDINRTDSVQLMKLPGIGAILSKRIIKYRDLLGGFYTFEQLKEVYGLKQQTIDQIDDMIVVDAEVVHKVDLNFSNRDELGRHPYIGSAMAERIIDFRTRYGKIDDASVLKDSMILRAKEYEKLKPYLEK